MSSPAAIKRKNKRRLGSLLYLFVYGTESDGQLVLSSEIGMDRRERARKFAHAVKYHLSSYESLILVNPEHRVLAEMMAEEAKLDERLVRAQEDTLGVQGPSMLFRQVCRQESLCATLIVPVRNVAPLYRFLHAAYLPLSKKFQIPQLSDGSWFCFAPTFGLRFWSW